MRQTMVKKFPLVLFVLWTLSAISSAPIAQARVFSLDLTTIISNKLKTLPISAFAADRILEQTVDRANKISTYRLKGEANPVYTRAAIDSGRDVIVFKGSDDKIPKLINKRLFVVLKKIEGSKYAVSLVIIREACKEDRNAVSINGKPRVIEWDYYDEHLIPGRPMTHLVKAFCASSMFTNCLFNQSVLVPESDYHRSVPHVSKPVDREERNEVEMQSFVSADGSDPDENSDYFNDLDTPAFDEERPEETVGVIPEKGIFPSSLPGASGVVCSILNLIGICGHGRQDAGIVGAPIDPALVGIIGKAGRRKRDVPEEDNSLRRMSEGGAETEDNNSPLVLVKRQEGDYQLAQAALAHQQQEQEQGSPAGSAVGYIMDKGLLSTGWSLVSTALCGAMFILGMCGTGRRKTATTIINESGDKLDPSIIQNYLQPQDAGGFTAGYGRRRKRDAAPVPTGLEYPGWKTQYINPTQVSTVARESQAIFFGFGNCPYRQGSEKLLNSPNIIDVVRYYRSQLRTHCIGPVGALARLMVSEGLLVLTTNGILEVPRNSRYLTDGKLGLPELLLLNSALELSSFSKVYEHTVRTGTHAVVSATPDGRRRLSKSVIVAAETILTYLRMIRVKARSHLVSLSRMAYLSSKSVLQKLSQDARNLELCGAPCLVELELNKNGRVYIMAVKQFIKRGLSPLTSGKNVGAAFHTFYVANMDKFESFVNVYPM